MNDRTIKQRLEKHIIRKDDCWITDLHCNHRGYPRIKVNNRGINASRVSFQLYNGEIPERMLVCHRCDNPGCVNPQDLFLGTHKDNMRDMIEKGRSLKGSKNSQSKQTKKEVFQIKALLSETNLTPKRIASLFDVCTRTISYIQHDGIWKHVNYVANSKNNSKSKKSVGWKQLSLFD